MPATVAHDRASEAADARCWVCGSSDASLWKARGVDRDLRPEDFQITDHRYGVTLSLYRCGGCGFIHAAGEEMRQLVGLYEQLADPGYEESQDTRRLQMQWLLDMIRKSRPEARTLLDIGAGAGLLVKEAIGRGFDATGVEPSRSLVEHARRAFGLELHQGIFPHPALAERRFDAILLVDVIEHVADPVGLLRDCAAALSERGVLMVVTPDVRSAAARLLRGRWWHFRLAHVGYFDRSTLDRAARRAGLAPVRWARAKWFFRVRYLAERVGEYLPVGPVNRVAERVAPLRWMYKRVVPLNLRDSLVVLLERSAKERDVR